MSYTLELKERIALMTIANVAHFDMNVSGYPLVFKLNSQLDSTESNAADETEFFSRGITAYFVDKWCVEPLPLTATPVMPIRDATLDYEYVHPHRVLVIDINLKCLGRAYRPSELLGGPGDSSEPFLRFVSIFVSEAHALHIQTHRAWLPANVVVFFPLAYKYVVRAGQILTVVKTLGFIMSPHDDNDAMPSGLPAIHFGHECLLHAGPASDAFKTPSRADKESSSSSTSSSSSDSSSSTTVSVGVPDPLEKTPAPPEPATQPPPRPTRKRARRLDTGNM
jgi:hypothetical protein